MKRQLDAEETNRRVAYFVVNFYYELRLIRLLG